MLACDIFVEAFQTDHVFWLGNEYIQKYFYLEIKNNNKKKKKN